MDEYFRTMFRYSYWARDRVLDQVAKLSPADYTAPRALDSGSIRATLLHNLGSDAGYLARWTGVPVDQPSNAEALPTFEALRERWSTVQQKMTAFVDGLSDEDVRREIRQISGRTGQETVNPLWALLAQCVNHGTQHRSEVALIITQLGFSPGDLDLTLYLRDPHATSAH